MNRRHLPAITSALTPRELTLLDLLAEGHTERQIARRMDCSPAVAAYVKSSLYRKLGARSGPHAVHIAHQRGLLGGAQNRMEVAA